jgi:sterol desaturase/sphingolipid hydroxylase (fatty acid hydroxylase superfamily)
MTDLFLSTVIDSFNWLLRLITFEEAWYHNYFYGLIIISLLVWFAELMFPWRKAQKAFRQDFWLDGFYMFFNFFIFSTVISGVYQVAEHGFSSFGFTIQSLSLFNLTEFFWGYQLLIFFILNDFVQWFTHLMLHRTPVLWKFHKVHHSIVEMGFAGHLRYHWMENIFYKPLKTLVVMLMGGFEPKQAFIVHFITLIIGHINHANIRVSYGPLKYVVNNPVMHLWHHAKQLPKGHQFGVNFGISLSLWDYIFKTAYVPEDSGNLELGFDDIEHFPKSFVKQLGYGFHKEKR